MYVYTYVAQIGSGSSRVLDMFPSLATCIDCYWDFCGLPLIFLFRGGLLSRVRSIFIDPALAPFNFCILGPYEVEMKLLSRPFYHVKEKVVFTIQEE